MCGLPASGKTTVARRLAAELPAVHFSLDEWMLRLHGLPYDDPRYGARVDACRELIWDVAARVVGLGLDVILDWNHWSRSRRADSRRRAEAAGASVRVHYVDVPVTVAARRAAARTAAGEDAWSHRLDDAAVRHAETFFEPPADDEGFDVVRFTA